MQKVVLVSKQDLKAMQVVKNLNNNSNQLKLAISQCWACSSQKLYQIRFLISQGIKLENRTVPVTEKHT